MGAAKTMRKQHARAYPQPRRVASTLFLHTKHLGYFPTIYKEQDRTKNSCFTKNAVCLAFTRQASSP